MAAEDPDRPAVVTEGRVAIYGQLVRHSAMLDLGVEGSGPDGQTQIAIYVADPTPSLIDIIARRAAHGWEPMQTVVCGGAGLVHEQRQRILDSAPTCMLFEYCGASELSLVIVKKTIPGMSVSDDSAGTAFPGVDIEIGSSADGPDTVWVGRGDWLLSAMQEAEAPLLYSVPAYVSGWDD